MAEPGAEAASSLTIPPPPPGKSGTAIGDATTLQPLQTDTADPGTPGTSTTPTPPPQHQTAAPEASGAASPPAQRRTGTGEVAGTSQPTRTPSQEKTVATGADNHLPAPPLQEQGYSAKDGNKSKDSAMEKPRPEEKEKQGPSRWRRVRSPVLLLLSLFRRRLRTQGQLIKQPKESPTSTEDGSAGDIPHIPVTEKDEGEGSKRRHNEAEASMPASGQKEASPMKPPRAKRRKSLQRTESVLPPEGDVGREADANPSPMKRKLQNTCWLVKNTMSWYHRHRSTENIENHEEQAVEEKEKLAETIPSSSPPEKEKAETKSKQGDKMDQITKQLSTSAGEGPSSPEMPHPHWKWVDERLERILEDACMRLVEAEFEKRLHKQPQHQQCLLTFSVFPLGSEVKKQAVTYWWSTWFQLPQENGVREAEEIFSTLSNGGFLESIKNRCGVLAKEKNRCGVIHGCRVNPLVHWTVKHMAREKELADLDGRGYPADDQPKSEILCLTPGNREQMQQLRDDIDSQARIKPSPRKVPPDGTVEAGTPSQNQKNKTRLDAENLQSEILLTYKKKKVILNISAHVYRLPKPLLVKLADQLEVMQLGRWGNSDDKTYMEVEALESLSAIGKLKNLRYLSLRGLSRLTELPMEIRRLRRLAILDARGCQNLVSVPSATVKKLKGLTHLDLTECYMLEHIGRGVSALSELRVFKGFVFGVGKRRRDACKLQHLANLKKLRKLNVNVTTDANVDKDEMAQLGKLVGLVSLTVTWGERPSVLLDEDDVHKGRLDELLNRWTGLVLPRELEKLDVRCYPVSKLPVAGWLNGHSRNLKKLYVRGGEVEELDIPNDNQIETLRLRYLNKFRMKWTNELLPKLNCIKCVEVVDKDLKVMRNQTKGKDDDNKLKDEHKKKKVKEEEEEEIKDLSRNIKKRMEIPESTIDENGVWVKDPMEEKAVGMQDGTKAEAATSAAGKAEEAEDGKGQTEVKGKQSSLKGTEEENEQPAEEVRGGTSEVKKVDGEFSVKEEKDHMKKGKDEELDTIKKDTVAEHEPTVDENRMQERAEEQDVKKKQASPTLAMETVALATDKQEESPIKKDKGDGSNADKLQAEGEVQGKDEGQEGDGEVFDEQPTCEDDGGGGGGGGDTSAADVKSSLAQQPQPPEPKGKLTPPSKTTIPAVTPSALPPASATTSASGTE